LWHEIITWNATTSLTATPTEFSPSAFHREFENNYLKCHPITDGHTDGLSPSAFHREFENNYLKCHPITDGLVRRHFTESSKIITWNATPSPTDLRPSAFHREFENNYLKCHPITDGHTDAFKSVGKLSAVQFYRQHYRRTARISKCCALNAPLTV
jgi:hypothetical protein